MRTNRRKNRKDFRVTVINDGFLVGDPQGIPRTYSIMEPSSGDRLSE